MPKGGRISNFWELVGLPCWLSVKESACQYIRWGFDPWVRKISWRRKWQPTLVCLPGKSLGQRSLVCYSRWCHKRVGQYWAHDGWILIHTHYSEMYVIFAWWILFRRSGLFALDAPGKSYGGTELQRDASLYTHTHTHLFIYLLVSLPCFRKDSVFQKEFKVNLSVSKYNYIVLIHRASN